MNSIELTKQFVAINSVNPFTTYVAENRVVGIGNEGRLNEVIEDLLRAKGFEVERQYVEKERHVVCDDGRSVTVPARWNILAQRGAGTRSLLLFGHSDTVDVKAGWATDPFVATEGSLHGRPVFFGLGANDMKSGLAAVLAAADTKLPKGGSLKIAILCDEEFWSFGASVLVGSDFLADVGLAIAPEISEESLVADSQWIGLGRLGRTEFEVQVQGRACHGADAFVDPQAINAATECAKVAVVLSEFADSERAVFSEEGVTVHNAAYLNLVQAGRGILSVPDQGVVVYDRSFLPGESADGFAETIYGVLSRAQASGRINPEVALRVRQRPRPTEPCKPFFYSMHLPQISSVIEAVKAVTPSIRFGIGRSVADENRLAALGIPTMVLGPYGAGSHTNCEWVDIESIQRLERMYQGIIASERLYPSL